MGVFIVAVIWQGQAILDGTASTVVIAGFVGVVFALAVGFWWMLFQNMWRGINAMTPEKRRGDTLEADLGIDEVMDLGRDD